MKDFKELIESDKSSEEIIRKLIEVTSRAGDISRGRDVPIETVKVGDIVSPKLRDISRPNLNNFPIFRVVRIEEDERGIHVFGKNERRDVMIRKPGSPVFLYHPADIELDSDGGVGYYL